MRKKRSGRRGLLAALLCLCASLVPGAPFAPQDAKPKRPQQAYAVILGTVFRESGHAFAGAEVVLVADPEPPGAGKKPKPQKLNASMRGEVVFRVPPGPMRYTLSVKAKGFKPMSKTVDIQADERQDVNFLLEVDKQ